MRIRYSAFLQIREERKGWEFSPLQPSSHSSIYDMAVMKFSLFFFLSKECFCLVEYCLKEQAYRNLILIFNASCARWLYSCSNPCWGFFVINGLASSWNVVKENLTWRDFLACVLLMVNSIVIAVELRGETCT